MMITAFKRVLTDYPDKKLLIFGDGELKESLEAFIKDEGVENNVFLMGKTDDVPSALKNAEVYLMTSDYEGMPNALLEAMAAGLPVICTNCPCGGPKMVIEDGINGFLINTGASDELAEKMRIVFGDERLRKELSKNAKIKAEDFLPEVINAKWKAYLESVISGNSVF